MTWLVLVPMVVFLAVFGWLVITHDDRPESEDYPDEAEMHVHWRGGWRV